MKWLRAAPIAAIIALASVFALAQQQSGPPSVAGGLTGLGTGVATALGVATNGSGGFPTVPVSNASLSPLASSALSDAGAWSTYVPTPTCGTGSGTWGAISGRYKQFLGKTTAVAITAVLTTVGTCTTSVIFTLPNTAVGSGSGQMLIGRENTNSGVILQGLIQASGTQVSVFSATNTGVIANGDSYLITGVYENQ